MPLRVRPFGRLPDGRDVDAVDLHAGDLAVTVLTYGATLASIRVPDRRGDIADVALGFDSLHGWLEDPQYFGAVVGRFANRIRAGRFVLDGRPVVVARNRGDHHLHGGASGFDRAVWTVAAFDDGTAPSVTLAHTSPDGDQGYPGTLEVTVAYRLEPGGSLRLDYEAVTDAPTVVNLTNHVYLNLAGSGTVLDHRVTLHAGAFLPVGDATLPTGEIRVVDGTAMDFRAGRRVGERIADPDPQLAAAGGYDHCWVVDGAPGVLRPCAVVEAAGRRLDVATTQPGVQFYSGNGIRPRAGRDGAAYRRHGGLCLETQHFPDSPNHPAFPSTRLAPGEVLAETTVMRFGAS